MFYFQATQKNEANEKGMLVYCWEVGREQYKVKMYKSHVCCLGDRSVSENTHLTLEIDAGNERNKLLLLSDLFLQKGLWIIKTSI